MIEKDRIKVYKAYTVLGSRKFLQSDIQLSLTYVISSRVN